MSSDDDSFTLRRFDRVHCRTLLVLQNRVVLLEEKLDVMDAQLSERDAADIDNGCFSKDTSEREVILDDLHKAIMAYDELLIKFLQLKARKTPPSLVIENLKAWLDNANNPIHTKEVEFLDAADLISIVEVGKSFARSFLEKKILRRTKALWGLVSHKRKQTDSATDDYTVDWDDNAVSRFENTCIFLAALVMLILPLWVLALVASKLWKLAVITIFLLCFISVLTWGTLARPFEVLAATAGYSAVLVVFIQFGAN